MADLELTKACAEAMGIKTVESYGQLNLCDGSDTMNYDPLHDDAQAMALVKKFELRIWRDQFNQPKVWSVARYGTVSDIGISRNADLNRAICECVAQIKEQGHG